MLTCEEQLKHLKARYRQLLREYEELEEQNALKEQAINMLLNTIEELTAYIEELGVEPPELETGLKTLAMRIVPDDAFDEFEKAVKVLHFEAIKSAFPNKKHYVELQNAIYWDIVRNLEDIKGAIKPTAHTIRQWARVIADNWDLITAGLMTPIIIYEAL
ncbi:MAG TPA: hypothetical protein ENF81_05855 [Thermotogaceae bacterium]|nr:hypothetical protein [Thermotogaceae bacterium]